MEAFFIFSCIMILGILVTYCKSQRTQKVKIYLLVIISGIILCSCSNKAESSIPQTTQSPANIEVKSEAVTTPKVENTTAKTEVTKPATEEKKSNEDTITRVGAKSLSDILSQTQQQPVMPGFTLYNADGFSIQVSSDWMNVSSETKYSSTRSTNLNDTPSAEYKVHRFDYKFDIDYTTELYIYPYDKKLSYEEFIKKKSMKTISDLKQINISNTDIAYEYKIFQDKITAISYYDIFVFKGDVSYFFNSKHAASQYSIEGSRLEGAKERMKKYRSDIEKMISTLSFSKENLSFETISKTQTPSLSLPKKSK